MLVALIHVFHTILPLFAFITSAAADPFCDHLTYGQPTYTDCRDLVYALYKGAPGQTEWGMKHFFSLRHETPPPWIPTPIQSRRTYLPIFVDRG